MADKVALREASAFGDQLLKPVAMKLVDAANLHIAAGNDQLALQVHCGAHARLASTMAAHLGIEWTVKILESCITTLRNEQRRKQH